jgi:GTP-binding protein
MHHADYYRCAHFLTSAARLEQAPPDVGLEAAFAGRSNAGKSSAINALCGQKGLARTSKTPGRTQLLNFFGLDDERRLVDLPGYGYAAVAASIRAEWQGAVAPYVERRRSLRGLVVLTDIRHPLRDLDLQLIDWASHLGRPVHVLLTKADKLGRGKASATLLAARDLLASYPGSPTVQLFSALAGQGVETLAEVLDGWLERGQKKPDHLGG